MSVAGRSRSAGLRSVTRLGGSELLDRLGVRKRVERVLYRGSRDGFRVAVAAGRTFSAVQRLAGPARQRPAGGGAGLFDLTPDEEQQMLCEAIADFAARSVRPAAGEADSSCATPHELLSQAAELGLSTLGIPEELGGAMPERSALTTVLAAEALAHGDLSVAFACLAPGAVACALGLWGDAEQQSTYLPAFAGEDPPRAALAVIEPQPAFDPFALQTVARRDGAELVLDGVKALVPGGATAELFVLAARLEDGSCGLVIVEAGSPGLSAVREPAMGLRAGDTARLSLEGVRVPSGSLLAEGDPDVYAECVQRGRLAWCALAGGCCRAALDYVIPYVNERRAFGEPIANRQGVAFAVADIAIELEGLRLVTWRAASRADRGEAFAREVALARSLCARHAMRIGSDAVQLLGGHGYVKEHPVERWYRDLRAAGLMEGALLA